MERSGRIVLVVEQMDFDAQKCKRRITIRGGARIKI
jgi:hypothetical protein